MAYSRRRDKSSAMPTGTIHWDYAGWQGDSTSGLPAMQVSTEDVVGNPKGDNAFSTLKKVRNVSPMDGALYYPDGRKNVYFSGHFIPDFFWGSFDTGIGATHPWSETADSDLVLKVLARSNPSRPVVDLPVLLFELKDLPRMIKQAGEAIRWVKNASSRRSLPTPTAAGMANANLAYQFGWAPLLSDLWKLATFADSYEKKKQQLTKLYSSRGLRSNVTLEEKSESHGEWYTHLHSFLYSHQGLTTGYSEYKAWGSCTWLPTTLPPSSGTPSDVQIYRAALGLDITLATVWEAIPWSWLIDWFSTAGDFLSAHRNTIPAAPGTVCIMKTRRTKLRTRTSFLPEGLTWGGATAEHTWKTRSVHFPNMLPNVTLPFLSASQLSILGSLHIARASNRRSG